MSGPGVPAAGDPPPRDGDAAAAEVFVPLHPVMQRRVQLAQSVAERGPVAALLVLAGVAGLRGGTGAAGLALSVAQVLAGAWQLFMFAVELRDTARIERGRRAGVPAAPAHPRVAWPDLAAGLLLGVEVWQLWSTTGRLRRPQAVLAAFTVAFGLVRGRLRVRRGLTVSAAGLTFRRRPWGGTTIAWSDAQRVELTPDRLEVTARDGRTIRLLARSYDGGHAALQAVRDALPLVAPSLAPALAARTEAERTSGTAGAPISRP
jgi:hypothetical protein